MAVAALAFACGGFFVFVSSTAFAQAAAATPTPTPTPAGAKTCADFSTQAAAQAYFNSKGGSRTNNVDNLDPNRNGIACEGLPGTPTATTSPTVAPTATTGTLNNTGVFSDLMAMSGLSLLEIGVGLSLLSERVRAGGKRAPLFVLKLLAKAARQGRSEVALADDVYIVRKPARPPVRETPDAAGPAPKQAAAPEHKPATVLLTPPIDPSARRAEPMDEFAIAVIGLDDDEARPDWPYFTPPDAL